MNQRIALLTAALLGCSVALAQPDTDPLQQKPTTGIPRDAEAKQPMHSEREFTSTAANRLLFGQQMADLGAKRGSNEKVTELARELRDAYKQIEAKMQVIADQQPRRDPELDSAKQKALGQLRELEQGESFDQAFVKLLTKQIDADVGLFDNGAGETTVSLAVQQFARQASTRLQQFQHRIHGLIQTEAPQTQQR
jgi:predicted outer membrane protein